MLADRDVAIAVAEIEKNRAALLAEISSSATFIQSDDLTSQCNSVYRYLWTTFSEIEFDPYPGDVVQQRKY